MTDLPQYSSCIIRRHLCLQKGLQHKKQWWLSVSRKLKKHLQCTANICFMRNREMPSHTAHDVSERALQQDKAPHSQETAWTHLVLTAAPTEAPVAHVK
jgi:hypothetical protein